MAARVARLSAVAIGAVRSATVVAAIALGLGASSCTPSTSTSQRLPIGSSCASSGECGTGAFYCDVGWPAGYCKVQCTSDATCPGGSVCVGASMLMSGACLQPCQAQGDCRDGYLCLADSTASHMYCAPPVMHDAATD